MKRILLPVVLLGATLLTSGPVFAQSASSPAPAAKQTKLVKVATIKGAQAVREFESNVKLVQAQRQAAVELNEQIEKEKNATKKKELTTKLDALLKQLTANNDKMIKAYGFSLARNYTMEIESANIYLEITDAEAAKIEATQKANKK